MSKGITHEQYVASVRCRVAAIAHGMLNGEVDFLEGAIELASLRHEAEVDENDPDFMAFVVIASETDSLPIGTSTALWSKEALAKHQPEIDVAIIWAKKVGILNETPEQRAVRHKRFKLEPSAKTEYARLDAQIPRLEAEERAAKDEPNKQVQQALLTSRTRFHQLRC